jgi:hypothetical protein
LIKNLKLLPRVGKCPQKWILAYSTDGRRKGFSLFREQLATNIKILKFLHTILLEIYLHELIMMAGRNLPLHPA